MLEDLTRYLRSSLSRTRDQLTTLGQELDLVRAYLDIYKVRMGERLRYTIEITETLRETPFRPCWFNLLWRTPSSTASNQNRGGEILIKAEDQAAATVSL